MMRVWLRIAIVGAHQKAAMDQEFMIRVRILLGKVITHLMPHQVVNFMENAVKISAAVAILL
jgi:hypothetical protein